MNTLSKKSKLFNLKKITVWDISAFAVFVALALWMFLYAIRVSVDMPDESFYYTIPQRLMQADRLLVDEWHVSQLSSLFQYLPYRLFVWISGSTEGIILFLRSLSVSISLLFYWFVYIKLRKYTVFGIAAAFLMSFWFPSNVFQFTYCNLPAYFMMALGLVLFLNPKKRPLWQLIIVGLIVACLVVAQPLYVLLYLLFSILCLIRAVRPSILETYDFFFNKKTWLGITIGCMIAFALVVGGIAIKSGIGNVIQTIPELFTDSEYDFSFGGVHFNLIFRKLKNAIRLYGPLLFICGLATSVLAGFYRKFFYKTKLFKAVLLATSGFFFVTQVIYASVYSLENFGGDGSIGFIDTVFFCSVPNAMFGFSCYALLEKKQPRIFLFWATSILMSGITSFGSDVFMSISGPFSVMTPILCMYELRLEVKNGVILKPFENKKNLSAVKTKEKTELVKIGK